LPLEPAAPTDVVVFMIAPGEWFGPHPAIGRTLRGRAKTPDRTVAVVSRAVQDVRAARPTRGGN